MNSFKLSYQRIKNKIELTFNESEILNESVKMKVIQIFVRIESNLNDFKGNKILN